MVLREKAQQETHMKAWMVLVAVAFVLAGCVSNKKVDQLLAMTKA